MLAIQVEYKPIFNSSCKVFRNFAITFLSSILAKCVNNESCRGDFPPSSPNDLVLVAQRDFLCIWMKILKLIGIPPKLLLTGKKKCICVTERGSLKNIRKRCISRLFKGCARGKTALNMLRIFHAYICLCRIDFKQAHWLGFHMTCIFSLLHML